MTIAREIRTAPVSSDPDATLDQRRGEAAAALAAGLMESEASRRVVAAMLACSETRVAAFADPEHDATLCIARASMLPAPAARRVAGWIAGEACMVIELPTGSDPEVDLSTAAKAHRASSAAVTAALDALADSTVDAIEGALIEKTATEAIRRLLALREIGRRAQRERGGVLVPMRGTR